MENFRFLPINKVSKLPKTPGVYAFKKNKELLYIGKAINIKARVKNHSLDQIKKVGYIKTDSEIEALILEARLIKRYRPKNNIVWKDDKNYFYIGITKESFPQLFITHQPKKTIQHIGPFVDGTALKETLKVLRRVFPYRTCKNLPRRPCLWYQLHRCPAPCLLESNLAKQIPSAKIKMKQECQRNIRNLLKLLSGKKKQVLADLKKQMKKEASCQNFEIAAKTRNQIKALERILANTRILEYSKSKLHQGRIEAYDISNIQGKEATGAMVVFRNGKPDKSQYRWFRIRTEDKPNDIAMIKEVILRRLKHPEWPYPDLMLIDGGRAQLNAALSIIGSKTKVMALAKKNNELYIEGQKKPVLLKSLPRETFNLILQLRDEAHRFARRYHHKLRKKALLG